MNLLLNLTRIDDLNLLFKFVIQSYDLLIKQYRFTQTIFKFTDLGYEFKQNQTISSNYKLELNRTINLIY